MFVDLTEGNTAVAVAQTQAQRTWRGARPGNIWTWARSTRGARWPLSLHLPPKSRRLQKHRGSSRPTGSLEWWSTPHAALTCASEQSHYVESSSASHALSSYHYHLWNSWRWGVQNTFNYNNYSRTYFAIQNFTSTCMCTLLSPTKCLLEHILSLLLLTFSNILNTFGCCLLKSTLENNICNITW